MNHWGNWFVQNTTVLHSCAYRILINLPFVCTVCVSILYRNATAADSEVWVIQLPSWWIATSERVFILGIQIGTIHIHMSTLHKNLLTETCYLVSDLQLGHTIWKLWITSLEVGLYVQVRSRHVRITIKK